MPATIARFVSGLIWTRSYGVRGALDGIEVAYYLIHSLGTGPSFEQRDRDAARTFADAARGAGVKRIVYLGGMISGRSGDLSPHPRALIPVPLLTPRLSSLWVGLVTPVPAGLAMPLVESPRNEVVCAEHDIAAYLPDPPGGLLPLDRAIELALEHTQEGDVSTRWSSAGTPGAPSDPLPSDPSWAGGSLYVDERTSVVDADPAALWRVIGGIGGTTGWYSFPAAWAARGLIDRLAAGAAPAPRPDAR